MERRLACILAADVVGYSRLMEADEEATLTALYAHRRFIDERIAGHRGRVFGSAGDSVIAEFASPVEAVRCAVEIQQELRSRNAGISEDRRMQFRIGVNLGDVVVEGANLHGDGVNIAARLEELADPGSVMISGTVHDHLTGKLDLALDDLGERELKNISRHVRVWRWSIDGAPPSSPSSPSLGVHPPLPDKPSIAVLPFDNLSGDPEQEYFADGMVEEIITALARFNWLHVIARNSCFTYKGRAIDIRDVSQELGVRYVLEGSVRKAANRVRITCQLIDAATGAHIWADRFDGEFEDIFDLQDRITAQVVGAIEPRLRNSEIERARRKRPDSLEAYDLYLRALPYGYTVTPESNTAALELLDQAIALDPHFAPAAALAAWCYQNRATLAWNLSAEGDVDRAVAHARAAIAADKDDANSLAISGFVLAMAGHDMEGSRMAVERAMTLNANDPLVQGFNGHILCFLGDQDAALRYFEKALRLSPGDPMAFTYLHGTATSHMLAGRFEEAVQAATRAAHESPNFSPVYRVLAASYAGLGEIDKAREAAGRLRELDPKTTIAHHRARLPYQDQTQFARLLDGLRKAGLPE